MSPDEWKAVLQQIESDVKPNRLIYCDGCHTAMYSRGEHVICETSGCNTTACESCVDQVFGDDTTCDKCCFEKPQTPCEKVIIGKDAWEEIFDQIRFEKMGYNLIYCSGCKKPKFLSETYPLECESPDCEVVSCEDCKPELFPNPEESMCRRCSSS